MNNREETQQDGKTISTSHSLHQLTLPHLHSYHKYESLLQFFVSFLTDLGVYITQLKQLTYNLIGVNISSFDTKHTVRDDCQYCQVQFMMHQCRTTRQDISRVVNLFRGYSNNINEVRKQNKFSKIFNECIGLHKQSQGTKYLKINEQINFDHTISRLSRQTRSRSMPNFQMFKQFEESNQNKLLRQQIIYENNQQSEISDSSMIGLQNKDYVLKMQQIRQNNQNEYKKIYKLINNIRRQVLSPH